MELVPVEVKIPISFFWGRLTLNGEVTRIVFLTMGGGWTESGRFDVLLSDRCR